MLTIRSTIVALATVGIVTTGSAFAQAVAGERAPVTRVLLENDKVKVTESTFLPGDVSRANRSRRVNYIVKGSTMERTSKDGKKEVVERVAGTAVWLEADSDVVKNIGKSTFVVIGTSFK
jgi:hypothetical protein